MSIFRIRSRQSGHSIYRAKAAGRAAFYVIALNSTEALLQALRVAHPGIPE